MTLTHVQNDEGSENLLPSTTGTKPSPLSEQGRKMENFLGSSPHNMATRNVTSLIYTKKQGLKNLTNSLL